MRISKLLTCLSLAALMGGASSAYALDLGVVGGLGISNPSTNITGVTVSGKTAPGFGAILGFGMGPRFDLESGVLYMPRKFTFGLSGDVTQNTIQIPLMLRFSMMPVISLGAGGYYATQSGDVTDASGNVLTGFKTSDYGLVGSVRLKFSLVPTFGWIIDARYLMGLNNLADTGVAGNTADFKHRDIQLLAGLHFGF